MASTLNFKKAKTETPTWVLSEKAKHPVPDDIASILASRPMKIREAVTAGYKTKPKGTLNLGATSTTPSSIQPRGMPIAAAPALPLNTLKRTRSDAEDLDAKKVLG
ncbi:hypothetical protein HDU67_007893 [Dinochytrium kinnereticum]|nr:hypothetical protein HDU67_007893 [Dinochytrium kinnereticum]